VDRHLRVYIHELNFELFYPTPPMGFGFCRCISMDNIPDTLGYFCSLYHNKQKKSFDHLFWVYVGAVEWYQTPRMKMNGSQICIRSCVCYRCCRSTIDWNKTQFFLQSLFLLLQGIGKTIFFCFWLYCLCASVLSLPKKTRKKNPFWFLEGLGTREKKC